MNIKAKQMSYIHILTYGHKQGSDRKNEVEDTNGENELSRKSLPSSLELRWRVQSFVKRLE